MRQHLTQEQLLGQRLSPRQLAFGRMLEMSAPEFEDEIRRVIDENPALEAVDPDRTPSECDSVGTSDFNETAEQLQQADYADPDDMPPLPRQRQSTPADFRPDNDPDDSASAYDRLADQLALLDIPDLDRTIALYIIGNIDSNGYLARSPQAIADDIAIGAGLDVDTPDVVRAMQAVRRLDPPGICALDLRDCLLLQLDRLDPARQAVADAHAIIDRRFDLFSKKHFDKIMAAEGFDRDRLDSAVRVITALNPKPGSQLEGVGSDDRTRHITPDFIIDTDEQGLTTVTLAGRIPDLALQPSFTVEATAAARGADAAFIKARRDEAIEFIDLTRHRSATLMAVMQAIVALQPDYFRTFDRSRLRPMVLRDIGALTGLDLSVISRATSSKYMATPQGVVALKSLFSEASAADPETSSHAVIEALRQIIAAEDKAAPLGDAALADILAERGMVIARRTVAKYRERLGYPVARLRRQ